MLLAHGYNDLGVQALLDAARTPKGSFYHHFRDKEDFALQVIDAYMSGVHGALDVSLGEMTRAPLDRVRGFFALVQETYRSEGYMGCLLGGLGQELSGVSDTFRRRIDACFGAISSRLATCFEEARRQGDIAEDAEPQKLAAILVDCWEGAALRSRLLGHDAPLNAMLDFYFQVARGRRRDTTVTAS